MNKTNLFLPDFHLATLRRKPRSASQKLLMLRGQWDTFNSGDIFLGDNGFCGFYDVSKLVDKAVDLVITLSKRKPVSSNDADQILGDDDLLIHWSKPKWTERLS